MKHIYLWMAAFTMMFASCSSEESIENGQQNENEKGSIYNFTASFESNEGRAYLGEDEYCYWETTDKVSVFNANGAHYTYSSDKNDVKITDLSTTDETSFTDGENIYAIYPYQTTNKVEGGTFTSTLPSNQAYDANKPSLNNAIMVATTQAPKSKFSFKNACALIKFELTTPGENITVESITVTSLSKVNLAGTVTIGSDNTATVSANGTNKVTLSGCANAGVLSADAAKSFIVVIPAGAYTANDMLINIKTSNEAYDKQAFLPAFEVARSKYIKVTSSLKKEELNIEEDIQSYKAIMCYNDLIVKQGFEEMEGVEHEYEIPQGDYTINGNGKTYTFTPDHYEGKFIYTTFTTKTSGIKGVTPGKITVNDLTITGTLRTTTMGIYVNSSDAYKPYSDQTAYNTEWNNVQVVDNKLLPYAIKGVSGADVTIGSAVCVYGTANLNNCTVSGAVQAANTNYPTVPIYDLAITNGSKTTLNKSTVGKLYSWEQANLVITNESKVNWIDWNTIYHPTIKNQLTINGSEITTLNFNGYKGYTSKATYALLATIEANSTVDNMILGEYVTYYNRITIKKDAHIKVLTFTDTTNAYLYDATNHPYGIKIEDGAIIDKIIVGEEEFTLEQFKARS